MPKQDGSGGKERRGGISKQGERTLRRLLVPGATAVTRRARTKPVTGAGWLGGLLERRPAKLAAVARANKAARIIGALPARGGHAPTVGQAAAA